MHYSFESLKNLWRLYNLFRIIVSFLGSTEALNSMFTLLEVILVFYYLLKHFHFRFDILLLKITFSFYFFFLDFERSLWRILILRVIETFMSVKLLYNKIICNLLYNKIKKHFSF